MTQSLLLPFLNVTESAAVSVQPYVGRGKEYAADAIATSTMRKTLNEIEMDASIVIGEGEIDDAPMLYIGEKVGSGIGKQLDIAVDPIEGTTPTANGQQNGMTVLAVAPEGDLLHAPDMYMKKMAVGPKAKGKINLQAPLIDNLEAIAKANGKTIDELQVLVQERPRHDKLVDEIREAGAKVQLFLDGDVVYTLATCIESSGVDLFIGTGGAPEGVVGAVAVKAFGGDMQAQLLPKDEVEVKRCQEMGLDNPAKILSLDDLVKSDDCLFVATGITDSLILPGLKVGKNTIESHSMLIHGEERKVRYINTLHNIE